LTRLFIKGKLEKELTSGRISHFREVPMPPAKFKKKFKVTCEVIENSNIFFISPKNAISVKKVLYLHGGSYVHTFVKQHWAFIEALIDNTRCSVVMPDYPLAPYHTFDESFSLVEPLYRSMVKDGDDDFILMGDSSGGGFALALALAQKMRNENVFQPSQIFLLSPWLDVGLKNPEIAEVEPFDPYLSIKGLRMAGKLYAGSAAIDNYCLSPVNGDLSVLADIYLFIGTHDILYPDAKRLKSICESKSIKINFYESQKMIHCWMLMGFYESKVTTGKIFDLINKKSCF
jgi:acetyl esterase/lipase